MNSDSWGGIEYYGYHSDGTLFYNQSDFLTSGYAFKSRDEDDRCSADIYEYHYQIKSGDVVGCGYSTKRACNTPVVYFTKNGKLIGTSKTSSTNLEPVMSYHGTDTDEGVVLKVHSQKEFLFKGFEFDVKYPYM